MRLAKPIPGTHWRFDRGDNRLLNGPIPKFELVEDTTGEVLGQVFINLSYTSFGVWFDSWLEVRDARKAKKSEALLDQLEQVEDRQWEVKKRR